MRIFLIASLLFLSFPVRAEVKIGYIDVQKALLETKVGIDAKKQLDSEIDKIKKKITTTEAGLKKQSEDLRRKEAVLSKDVFVKEQTELQKKVIAFQQEVTASQLSIQKKEQDLTKPILTKILSVATKIGTEKGYDLILQKNEMAVLWGNPSLDLTDQVMKEIDSLKKDSKN